MSGAFWSGPPASQTLYGNGCTCCVVQPWPAGVVLPILQMWEEDVSVTSLAQGHSAARSSTLPPGAGAAACGVAWRFPWTQQMVLCPTCTS